DVRMPGMSGIELQQQLKDKKVDLPIIFITGHGDIPMAIRAMKAGAFEFLTKPFNDQMLLDSINKAIEYNNEQHQNLQEFKTIIKHFDNLTLREKQVMGLVSSGNSNKVIGDELHISKKTVEVYRAKVMLKMQAKSLAELVRFAIQLEALGIISQKIVED
ncbi:MAG: response regulator transcription factor, partial [Gammaproteobacteria bacterium]|nr:response regulator transcription factor [Gammaproteobacteria bacterium]